MAAAHPFGAFVRYQLKRIGCVRRIKVNEDPSEATVFTGCDGLGRFPVYARIMPNVHR